MLCHQHRAQQESCLWTCMVRGLVCRMAKGIGWAVMWHRWCWAMKWLQVLVGCKLESLQRQLYVLSTADRSLEGCRATAPEQ